MNRFSIAFGLITIMLASCSIQEDVFESSHQDNDFFYASFELPSDSETRVYVNKDYYLRWNAEDRVSIFNRITYNQQYIFQGATGDNAGTFQKVEIEEFVTGNEILHVVSVFPYRESTRISESEIISFSLPAEQIYAEDSFGPDANTMVSVSSDNVLQFKNAGGYLVFSLYGEDLAVSSITFKGNREEKLAGRAFITMPLDGDPSVEMAEDATTEITLVCETPVPLGATAEESTPFWVVVPPTSFTDGFTVIVTDSKGGIYEKTTAKSLSIDRNRLYRMTPFGICPSENSTPEAIDLGLPSGLLWASMNVGSKTPSDVGGRYAWGEIETKSYYDWDNYKWCNGTYDSLTKYCTDDAYGTVDGKTILDDEDDVAKVLWGNGWRMPKACELEELTTYCTWTPEYLDDFPGFRVTGPNGNSIFIPENGQYDENGFTWQTGVYLWASETVGDYYAYRSVTGEVSCSNHRHDGLCVRPVKQKEKEPIQDAIDLGLPSGLRWASMNVGSKTPSDVGGRYAWGEIETKSYYDWDNYKWCNGTYDSLTKYCTDDAYGTVDGKTILDDEDDVAKVLWGNGWRMPKACELEELTTYCTWTPEYLDDFPGFRVTGPNGNSIFIPENGQYDENGFTWQTGVYLWASETVGDYYAYRSVTGEVSCSNHRHDGLCVRPVYDDAGQQSN